MPHPPRRQRLSIWFASLGFLLSLLAPLVTHALQHAGADMDLALAAICSASHATGDQDHPAPGDLPDEDHHCPACMHLLPLAASPAVGLLAPLAAMGTALRVAALAVSLHREPVWPAAQARAPPLS